MKKFENSHSHIFFLVKFVIKFENHYFTHINSNSYLLSDTFISNIIDILDVYLDELK